MLKNTVFNLLNVFKWLASGEGEDKIVSTFEEFRQSDHTNTYAMTSSCDRRFWKIKKDKHFLYLPSLSCLEQGGALFLVKRDLFWENVSLGFFASQAHQHQWDPEEEEWIWYKELIVAIPLFINSGLQRFCWWGWAGEKQIEFRQQKRERMEKQVREGRRWRRLMNVVEKDGVGLPSSLMYTPFRSQLSLLNTYKWNSFGLFFCLHIPFDNSFPFHFCCKG